MGNPIENRYDFVLYFDVENGNPNGDPDAGNMPRVDVETGHGLVTDVCLKRKIRNYVEAVYEGAPGYEIYVKEGVPLNRSDERAFDELEIDVSEIKKLKAKNPEIDSTLRDAMCRLFYDVRTFGAVMTTFMKNGLNCGQVRGPVQLTFGRSVDPIAQQEVTITRLTTTDGVDQKTMGRKYIIPYALYRCEGFVSANLARRVTGLSEKDLDVLWEAILNMFELDRSAARGNMSVRALIVFKHDNELGRASAHMLFDAVHVRKRDDVEYPRSFADYGDIVVDEEAIPEGVEVIRKA